MPMLMILQQMPENRQKHAVVKQFNKTDKIGLGGVITRNRVAEVISSFWSLWEICLKLRYVNWLPFIILIISSPCSTVLFTNM